MLRAGIAIFTIDSLPDADSVQARIRVGALVAVVAPYSGSRVVKTAILGAAVVYRTRIPVITILQRPDALASFTNIFDSTSILVVASFTVSRSILVALARGAVTKECQTGIIRLLASHLGLGIDNALAVNAVK